MKIDNNSVWHSLVWLGKSCFKNFFIYTLICQVQVAIHIKLSLYLQTSYYEMPCVIIKKRRFFRFFMCSTIGSAVAHAVDWWERIHEPRIFWMSPFALSTLPCDWGLLGRPWSIIRPGHSILSAETTAFRNSLPLSLCNMKGQPQLPKSL